MPNSSSQQIEQPALLNELEFCLTEKHECGYLKDKQATTLFVNPAITLQQPHYSYLATKGFRRSGNHVYRPHCDSCNLCIPVRLDVDAFKASKQQKRCWKKNTDISSFSHPAQYNEEHFQLYSRYLSSRHPGEGMDPGSKSSYMDIIKSQWSHTELLEFRRNQELVAVAVIDKLNNGLSAVYTFFDPELSKLSLGILCIQHEIELAKQRNLKWLYLGYWNPESQKMSYKVRFQPLEYFVNNDWQNDAPKQEKFNL